MATSSPARPDLRSYERTVRLDTSELVKELREALGAKLVAFLGGVRETRAVRQWADGERNIQDRAVEQRLRIAHQAAAMILVKDSPRVAQAWFQGLNPHLEDRSPARILRDGDLEVAGPQVLAAARAFAATG
ncbi:hypothetical protein [Nakamurella endophytica]|uniref:DUF2384 domain-containing protein n=1 Tax=Nakamurella endophytica TaxID=1748367 RepID=A0A917T5A3_9ACTN|nr:hypothetical protein [Nakamurella endophytica]GGM10000.1 hypothetical protein GCM10011594_32410 [Nakamurella endophytica]